MIINVARVCGCDSHSHTAAVGGGEAKALGGFGWGEFSVSKLNYGGILATSLYSQVSLLSPIKVIKSWRKCEGKSVLTHTGSLLKMKNPLKVDHKLKHTENVIIGPLSETAPATQTQVTFCKYVKVSKLELD